MANAEELRSVISTYLECWRTNDRETWLGLFTENATLIDPVGSEANQGREAIAAFWDRIHHLPMTFEPKEERLVVCENESLLLFTMTSRAESGTGIAVTIADTFVHDDTGKIRQLKAYWDNACVGPAK